MPVTDARTPEPNNWKGRRQQAPRQTVRSVTTVGAKLREAREALDLKQEWVADQLGIPQERYSRYETGRTKRPDPEKLVALAKLYGFPDEHFLAMVGFRSGADLVARLPPNARSWNRPWAKRIAWWAVLLWCLAMTRSSSQLPSWPSTRRFPRSPRSCNRLRGPPRQWKRPHSPRRRYWRRSGRSGWRLPRNAVPLRSSRLHRSGRACGEHLLPDSEPNLLDTAFGQELTPEGTG